jgi:hypothetical protein
MAAILDGGREAGFFFFPNELKFEQQVNFSERYDICYKMSELLKIETSSNGKNASELFDIYEFFHDMLVSSFCSTSGTHRVNLVGNEQKKLKLKMSK